MLCNAPGEMYGLQIINESSGRVKEGSAYVTLGRMAGKGLVTFREEERREGARGRLRRMYSVTDKGRAGAGFGVALE